MDVNSQIELAGRVAEGDSYSKYYNESYERNGSPKGFDLEKVFGNPQAHINDVFNLSKYYYHKVGIIMRVVNIVRDFGISGYKLNYRDKVDASTKEIIEKFNERINLSQVLRDMIFELGLTGNVAGYNRDGKRIDIYPVTKIEVSPLIVNNKPVLIYKNEMALSMDEGTVNKQILKKLKLSYPKELAKGLAKGEEKIVLDVTNTFFHKVNSSRYEPYGLPFILTAFDELAHKTVLKEAERATATGIIEKILRISVGDKDHKPKQPEINFYDAMLTSKKGSIKATVPYFVNMEWIEPDTAIFGKEKFEQVDTDILNALGISLTLIRGEGGGNYSEGFIAITGLIKTIENLREGLPVIVKDWYRQELERNGKDPESAPDLALDPVEIDKSAKIEMLKYLFQTAGLPYEMLYKESGYDFLSVKLMREQENKDKLEDTFKSRQSPEQMMAKQGAGAPTKPLSARKSDKAQSNNNQPRPSTTK